MTEHIMRKRIKTSLIGLTLVLGYSTAIGAEEKISLDRSGLENVYTCAEVASRLRLDDASAQRMVIGALENAFPEVKLMNTQLRALAKQRADAAATESGLRRLNEESCKTAVVHRIN